MEEIRIRHPVSNPKLRRRAARRAARTRGSLDWLLGRDAGCQDAFSELRADHAVVAVSEGRIAGVLVVRRGATDGWITSASEFRRQWGPLGGPLRLAVYRLLEAPLMGERTYITVFSVHPGQRGQGLGGRMLTRLLETTPGPVTLLARTERMDFYARHGFVPGGGPGLRLLGLLSRRRAMRRG